MTGPGPIASRGVVAAAVLLLAASACRDRPGGQAASAAPGARRDVTAWVGDAERAAIGDLDGDGRAEIVLASDQALRVVSPAGRELARSPAPGGPQVLVVADLGHDGRAEIIAGWGISRAHREARATIIVYHLVGDRLVEEAVPLPPSERNEVAAVVPPMAGADELLVAYYADKYMVQSAVATRGVGGWTLRDLARLRMATSYARGDVDGDGRAELVVGRVYGDELALDGDAFELGADGQRIAIPTTRGVRGLALADTDGDGRAEVFLGDGWDRDYVRKAHGLLSWGRWQDGRFRTEPIDDVAGQYTLWQLLAADAVGDGHREIVTRGNAQVRVYRRAADRWRGLAIGGVSRDLAVGDLDGVPGDEVLIVGDRSEIVSLRDLAW